tara:strand:+ start:145 stop:1353 length:1209 start_codon:yes stop_codon:yes gene_type:complete
LAKSALQEISSLSHLETVWKDMFSNIPRKKRHTAGIDEVSAKDFENNKKIFLTNISRALLTNDYKPSPLVAHFIPKSNGKDRVICVPTITDRLVQRAVLNYLNKKGYTLDNEISFGFIKGQDNGVKPSLYRAIELRNSSGWAYKADISAFFDTVDRDLIKQAVTKKIRAASIRKLVSSFIDTEVKVRNSSEKNKLNKNGIKEGIGLRQGMPISPYLANLFLTDFDKLITKKKIQMVRYADDLIAFAKSSRQCESIHDLCKGKLRSLGLEIHDIGPGSKTEIKEPHEMVEFLGVGLEVTPKRQYQLIVPDSKKAIIKNELYKYKNISFCAKHDLNISTLQSLMLNKIDGYLEAYRHCVNAQALGNFLADTYQCVMHSILLDEYKIDLNSLSKNQINFLRLTIK